MEPDDPWRHWVHSAMIHAVGAHLVGTADAVAAARRVATDLGNQGFVWTVDYYTPTPPPAAQTALRRAQQKLFTASQWSVLAAPATQRPTIGRDRQTLVVGETVKLRGVDAPAALAAWNLLHPGPTKDEIKVKLVVGGVECLKAAFAKENEWVDGRVHALRRAAAGLAVRHRSKRRKRNRPRVAAQ